MRSPCTASRHCRKGLRISATPIRPRPRAGAGPGRARHLRQPQSVHREGPSAHGHAGAWRHFHHRRLRGRRPDGARLRRAVHALRPDCPACRNRQRAHLRDLRARSGGAIFRRQADHTGGRALLLAAPARQGPPEPPHLLQQGDQGGGGRIERRPLRSSRRRPRAAADPRADAGASEARDRSGDVRGDHRQADDRQRTLRHRQGRSRQEPHARSQSELLGTRSRRSIAGSGISTRSATISIAIRTPCSKPSSATCSMSARRPIPRAGSRATISPRCATDRSSRRR